MQAIGIKQGQIVLDFGAGEGNYTIPAAHIVGEKGKIYAYEKDKGEIFKLKGKIAHPDMENIQIVESKGTLPLPFKENFFDVILLYDVLHQKVILFFYLQNLHKLMRFLLVYLNEYVNLE